MRPVSAFCAGALFGAGLLLSGMTNPSTVLAFLDIGGDWNPALALTMGGAIAVAAPAFYHRRRRAETATRDASPSGPRAGIDRRLLAGAGIFGVGWGLSGICPGPGLVLLTSLAPGAYAFVASMLAGMFLARRAVRETLPGAARDDLSSAGD